MDDLAGKDFFGFWGKQEGMTAIPYVGEYPAPSLL
jgi:hypothetical protein